MSDSIVQRNHQIFQVISSIYNTMHYFNLKEGICEEFYAFKEVHDAFVKYANQIDIQTLIHTVVKNTTSKEYEKSMLEFTTFSTLQERIAGKKNIVF